LQQDWQFKIVHGDFTTLERVYAVMREQSVWGWVFVEKFDGKRIRFKRPSSEAANDVTRPGNPYSTRSQAAGSGPMGGCANLALLAFVFTGFICWLVHHIV
jgi:hypothetical protein